ncbi:MAG: L-serine dehydratase, beta chain [Eubacteriales bacterium SKADARSKE-1]|nr:L-serine dehydratase, beta chain [Eubacteriales bacterium SKADARSKE-1]
MGRGLFGVLGPSMIGPSSSHTAGAARIGLMCRSVARKDVKSVTFFLHGSFATTYKGHGTDRALVGGLLGMKTDDERIIHSLELAQAQGMEVHFVKADLGNVHPNTVKAEMVNIDGETSNIVASSVGGGEINVVSVNGFPANISGNYNAVVISHLDKVGMISRITSLFERNDLNIVSLYNNREGRGKTAITIIEMDGDPDKNLLDELSKIECIYAISSINKI